MIKSRKLFARALYLVFALALVAGLTLVPAVAADSPADTDVGFEFGIVGTNTVEWAAVPATGLPVGGLGNYSVLLTKDNSATGSTHVDLALPGGITVSDLEALTNEYSFWYSMTATSSLAGPQLELLFASPAYDLVTGAGRLEITFVPAQAGTVITAGWHEVVVDDATLLGYGGQNSAGVGFFEWSPLTNLDGIVAAIDLVMDGTESVADWELIRVRAELYEIDTRTCYIDDVTIDGTLYELEPIFLDKDYYSVGDTIEVTVPNFNVNTDSIRVNPVTAEQLGDEAAWWQVIATSDSDSQGITVDLEETGIDTGVFTGLFTTTDTLPAAEDELYVEDGDDIIVTYGGTDPLQVDWGTGEFDAITTLTASVDDTEPTITIGFPADDEMIEETMPEISATYEDAPDVSGIDEDSVEISVDGVDVTDDAEADGSGVAYTPEDDLAEGSHDVTVSVSDLAGNEATESWSFRVVSWLETDSVACEPELDALDTVGVAVSITGDDASITVGRYASNPEPDADAPSNLIEDGFFDAQVTFCFGQEPLIATQIIIKFADDSITAESTAYVFDDLQGMWLACSDQGYNPTNEFLWVKVREADTTPNISELGGTPFAISGMPEVTKGDFNGDNAIDFTDFVQFAGAYDSVSTDSNYNVIGDFDDDGKIDFIDFVRFASVYGTSW